MAGGIFVDQPFVFNPKCVYFGIALIAAYWYLPAKNVYILPVIFITAYISMAWYDHFYQCQYDKLYSGTGYGNALLDSIFKPQRRNEIPNKLSNPNNYKILQSEEQETIYLRNVYLFHLIFVAPLLFYIGNYGLSDNKISQMINIIASIVVLYHGYRFVHPRNKN